MDTLINYAETIIELLKREASRKAANAPDLERLLIVNEEKTKFLVLVVGWHEKVYRHYVLFHIQLKGDKIWLHENRSELDVAKLLVDKGAKKSDIVLGFLSPAMRKLSEYAVEG